MIAWLGQVKDPFEFCTIFCGQELVFAILSAYDKPCRKQEPDDNLHLQSGPGTDYSASMRARFQECVLGSCVGACTEQTLLVLLAD